MSRFILHKILIEEVGEEDGEEFDILDEDELVSEVFATYDEAKAVYDQFKPEPKQEECTRFYNDIPYRGGGVT